jgi:hypothetical protein
MHLRLALQAGLGPEAIHSIAGGQMQRLLDGEDPLYAGPPPGVARPIDPLLERVVSHSAQAIARTFGQGDPTEPVALTKLACGVGEDGAYAEVHAAVLGLLETYEANIGDVPEGMRIAPAARLLVAAMSIARTPDVPLPDLPSPPPTREEADA